MGKASVFERFVGLMLALTLSATQILASVAIEAADAAGLSSPFDTANLIQQLSIPDGLGTVEEIFEGRKDEFVIFIQDAHANLSAQKSIASLIEIFSSELNVTLLAEEGAEGEIDTSLLRAIPAREITKAVLERHLRRGRLNGAEFYASTTDRNINFVGVDRRKLYLQNLSELIALLDRQEQALQSLSTLNTTLKNIQDTVYSKSHKEFNDLAKRYASGHIETGAFLKELAQRSELEGVDVSRYPHLKKLTELLGKGTSDRMEFNPADIHREIGDLISALKSRYAEAPVERKLASLEEYFTLFEKGFRLELSSDDAQRLNALHRVFQEKEIETVLKEAAAGSRLKRSIDSETTRVVEENYERIASFYRTAKKRDGEMAKRLFTKLDRQLEGGAILIAGGFHREGITGKLRRKGISYAVISPSIGEFTSHEDYLRLMEQSRTLLRTEKNEYRSEITSASTLRSDQSDVSTDTLSVPSQLGFPQLRTVFLSEVVAEIFGALQRNPRRFGFHDAETLRRAVLENLRREGVLVLPGEELAISSSDRLLAAERAVRKLDAIERRGVELSKNEKRNVLVSAVRGTAARFSNLLRSTDTIPAGFGSATIKPVNQDHPLNGLIRSVFEAHGKKDVTRILRINDKLFLSTGPSADETSAYALFAHQNVEGHQWKSASDHVWVKSLAMRFPSEPPIGIEIIPDLKGEDHYIAYGRDGVFEFSAAGVEFMDSDAAFSALVKDAITQAGSQTQVRLLESNEGELDEALKDQEISVTHMIPEKIKDRIHYLVLTNHAQTTFELVRTDEGFALLDQKESVFDTMLTTMFGGGRIERFIPYVSEDKRFYRVTAFVNRQKEGKLVKEEIAYEFSLNEGEKPLLKYEKIHSGPIVATAFLATRGGLTKLSTRPKSGARIDLFNSFDYGEEKILLLFGKTKDDGPMGVAYEVAHEASGFGAAPAKEPEDPIGTFIAKQLVQPIRNDVTIQSVSVRHLDSVLHIQYFDGNGDVVRKEQIPVKDYEADNVLERIKIWAGMNARKKANADIDLNGEVKIANLRLEINITENQTTHSHIKEMVTIFVAERSEPPVGFGSEIPNQDSLRVAMAQMNPRIGDLVENYKKIIDNIEKAAEQDVDVIVFPELILTGYPPQDLLRKVHFVRQNKALLKSLIPRVRNITAVIGFVDFDESGNLYNAVAIISNGELKGIYRKRDLPNYGVFDEKRYFIAGRDGEMVDFEGKLLNQKVFDLDGKLICVNICEDIWVDGGVYLTQSSLGAKLLINTSASPYREGVGQVREELLKKRAKETGATIVYTNSVGGQDMLVFDGSSFVIAPDGKILERGKEFEEELVVADIPVARMSSQATPGSISISGAKAVKQRKSLKPRAAPEPSTNIEKVYKAIVLGLHDYATKNKEKFSKAVFGLSGGIDSAVVAVLAKEAFGPENVTAYSLPTRFNSNETRADARRLARNLGIHFKEISIQTIFFTYLFDLAKLGGIPRLRRWFAFALYGLSRIAPIKGLIKAAENLLIRKVGIAEENLQARIRMSFLMTMANRSGAIMLSTSDKSETAVDYTTLYGDMAGLFAPILDLLKTQAYQLARYINQREGREMIPMSIIAREPTGELNENQWDSDLLPPYELLDQILEAYLERNESIEEMAKKWPRGEVEWVVQQVDGSESQRKQGPPGLKISRSHLGLERRMPINHSYREQDVDRFLRESADEPITPSDRIAPSPRAGFGVKLQRDLADRIASLKAADSIDEAMDIVISNYPEIIWLGEDGVAATPEAVPQLRTAKSLSVRKLGKSSIEFDRTSLSVMLLLWIIRGDYERFTASQPEGEKLSKSSFAELQSYVSAFLGDDAARLDALITHLVIHDLGKTKRAFDLAVEYVKSLEIDHDRVLNLLLSKLPEALPSFNKLPDRYKSLIHNSARTDSEFGHFAFGERPASSLQALWAMDAESIEWYLMFSLLDLAGARGHVTQDGSLLFNESLYQIFKLAGKSIRRFPEMASIEQVYKEYLTERALRFGITGELGYYDRAVVKLGMMFRMSEKNEFVKLTKAFHALGELEQNILAEELNKTGLNDGYAIFPNYGIAMLVNAYTALPSEEGIQIALRTLARVFQQARIAVEHRDGNGIFSVNIHSLAVLAKTPRELEMKQFILEPVGQDAKLRIAGPMEGVGFGDGKIPGGSWGNVIEIVSQTVSSASAQSLEEIGSFETIVFSRLEDFERFERNVLKYKPEILARVLGRFVNVVVGWDVSGLTAEEKNALWLRFARIFTRRGQKIFVGTDDREIFASIRQGTQAALLGPETEYLLNKVEDRYKLYLMQRNGDHFIAVVSEALRLAYLAERVSSISA